MELRKTIIFRGIAADVVETLKERHVKNLSNIVSRVLVEAAEREDFRDVLAQEVRASELPELIQGIKGLYPNREAEVGMDKEKDISETKGGSSSASPLFKKR